MNLPSKAVAAALVAASLASISTPADAQWGWRRGWGGIGFGLAAGAIIGGAIAASSYNYGYYGYPYRRAYYYGGYPAYAYYPDYVATATPPTATARATTATPTRRRTMGPAIRGPASTRGVPTGAGSFCAAPRAFSRHDARTTDAVLATISAGALMPTPKELRLQAAECLKLADESKDVYVKDAHIRDARLAERARDLDKRPSSH